jgi:hypothetical protein
MRRRDLRIPTRISGRTIMAATIMLFGVLSLSYGHFGGNKIMWYIGLMSILVGVVTEIASMVIPKDF